MKFGLFYLPTYLPAVRDAQTHYRGIIEQIEFADRDRHRLCLASRAPFRAPRRLVPGELRFLVLPRGAHQAHPARHRRHRAAAQRCRAGGGAGRDAGPIVTRPVRFRRRARLHP